MNPDWQRIHPRAILADFLSGLGRLFSIVIVLLLVSLAGGRDRDGAVTEIMLGIFGLLAAFGAVVRYFTFRYSLHQGNLLVESNVFGLWKDQRTIPVDRIQNINIKRSLVHQVLGLCSAEIETGAGAKPEAQIDGITEGQADQLKISLGRMMSAQKGEPVANLPGVQPDPGLLSHVLQPGKSPEQIIYKAKLWDLFVAGSLGNRWYVLVGFLVGLPAVFSTMLERNPATQQIITDARQGSFGGIVIGAMLIFFAGWAISIFQTLVKYWNFELSLEEGKFARSYGLTERIENVLPVKRIQGIQVVQGFFEKMLELAKVKASTAGGLGTEQKGEDALSPVLPFEEVPRILNFALPGIWLSGLKIIPVIDRAFWYYFLSGLWFRVLLSLLPLFWFPPLASLGLFAGLNLVSYIRCRLWREKAGYSLGRDILVTYDGYLGTITTYIPTAKIQAVSLHQNFFLQLFGLAVVTVKTAASGGMSVIKFPEIPLEDAKEIVYKLHELNKNSKDSLLDGL
jgi:putative membrane protein